MVTAFRHDESGTTAQTWRDTSEWSQAPLLDDAWLGDHDLVVVVAAHPDDETLGAAGLLRHAARTRVRTLLVALTDGEGSHPCSPTHDPRRMALRRREELDAALAVLHPGMHTHHLGLPDGGVEEHHDVVVAALVDQVAGARRPLIVAPWRRDGHTDHEAAGAAAAAACRRTDADLLEYPVWFWHWGRPEQAPWPECVALRLDGPDRAAKAEAIDAHTSQVRALSERPGDQRLLSPAFCEHFTGDRELFVRGRAEDDVMERLHRERREPWGADTRWYEERKRSLTLAALPWRTFSRALEIGCSTGMLADELAPRVQSLVAVDSSASAVAAARQRLHRHPHTRVEQVDVPTQWPTGRFDLVLVSEVGYFLSPAALDQLVERIRTCLSGHATVLVCHWRHRVEGWPLDGPDVHRRVRAAELGRVAATYADDDVEILVLTTDGWPDAGH